MGLRRTRDNKGWRGHDASRKNQELWGGGVVVVASFGLLKKVVADWFIVLIFSFIPLL